MSATTAEQKHYADVDARVKAWRKHPNYRKTCECSHRSVLHVCGERECSGGAPNDPCPCREFRPQINRSLDKQR